MSRKNITDFIDYVNTALVIRDSAILSSSLFKKCHNRGEEESGLTLCPNQNRIFEKYSISLKKIL